MVTNLSKRFLNIYKHHIEANQLMVHRKEGLKEMLVHCQKALLCLSNILAQQDGKEVNAQSLA